MAKFGFLGILLISIALFGSCSNNGGLKSSNSVMPVHSSDQQGSSQNPTALILQAGSPTCAKTLTKLPITTFRL